MLKSTRITFIAVLVAAFAGSAAADSTKSTAGNAIAESSKRTAWHIQQIARGK